MHQYVYHHYHHPNIAKKKAQTVVYTVVWAAMSPQHLNTPYHHHHYDSSRGLETRHVSSPWYIFLNIFWTSTNIYTLVHLPPLPPSQHHKKRPKQRFIPLFGPLHHQVTSTHRQATSTSWISGGRLGSSRGAQDGHVSSLWYILILFLYYTNVYLVNIYHNVYHHHTTQQPKKGPNGGLYHRLGCYVTSSPWHATMSPQHVESAVGAGWQ